MEYLKLISTTKKNTWENYHKIAKLIDEKFEKWKKRHT